MKIIYDNVVIGVILLVEMSLATISDVAKAAGVSVKTVSRVLNKEPNVQASTRERVLKFMRQLDYAPFTAARTMRTKKTGLIGVIRFSVLIINFFVSKTSSNFTVTDNLFCKNDFCIPISVFILPGLEPVVNFIFPLPPIVTSNLAIFGRLRVIIALFHVPLEFPFKSDSPFP